MFKIHMFKLDNLIRISKLGCRFGKYSISEAIKGVVDCLLDYSS